MISVAIHVGSREVATLRLVNDGTGTAEVGHYEAAYWQADGQGMNWPLRDFPRAHGLPALIARALDEYADAAQDARLRDEWLTGLPQDAPEAAP